ncbi:hypothetical protein DZB84_06820 [Bacillus sp. HNG]|uniref:hypothetical protein n=1 Tax=Bacillus sp. HNG TaxID=2293325 RepID=UPI000E2FC9C5|nr:hypothetical protein [Bacillus sp. HNG]RFB17560.1 hypothetical protein DZB84_06820 [Bacillus sp. HNG]
MDSPIKAFIDFIMSNPLILIVIFGFFINAFKRFASGNKEPTTQIPLPKQFNPFDQEPKPEKEDYQAETKYDYIEPAPELVSDSHVPNTFYERFQELQEKGIYKETSQDEEQIQTVIKPLAATSEHKAVRSFSKNKVVEGIIWSEILGPPRAKRPYQTRR